jgi:hypothetical protein
LSMLLKRREIDVRWELENAKSNISHAKLMLKNPALSPSHARIKAMIAKFENIIDVITEAITIDLTENNTSSVAAVPNIHAPPTLIPSGVIGDRVALHGVSNPRIVSVAPRAGSGAPAPAPAAPARGRSTEIINLTYPKTKTRAPSPYYNPVNKPDRNGSGDWALLRRVRENDLPAVVGLLESGADVNKVHPITGETALLAAAMIPSVDMVNLLVYAGADVNAVAFDGFTFKEIASEDGGFTDEINKIILYGPRPPRKSVAFAESVKKHRRSTRRRRNRK